MRSRSGIESAFIPRSWRSLVQPRMGRQFIAWRRQPQGIPKEPTIILSPRGGGRGNSRQGRRRCRVARADRDSQVSALGAGLRSGAPFRCTHRIAHRKRGPLSTRRPAGLNSPVTRSSAGFVMREIQTGLHKPESATKQRLTKSAENSAPICFPNCASICLGSRVSFDLPLA